MRIRDLKGLGPKSEKMLAKVGVDSVDEFMKSDPYRMYEKLVAEVKGVNRNFIYAIIGAQENISWQDIARERKTEILFRLDDMGLAPK